MSLNPVHSGLFGNFGQNERGQPIRPVKAKFHVRDNMVRDMG